MRLPQDRILHIDTELAGDEVRVVAEWQGELVRCKDCRYQEHCYQTVGHTKVHDDYNEHWSETIEWCSRGEKGEKNEILD